MGMYDHVRCLYPLPWPPEELATREWQSKSTPAQYLDQYEIRADGTLWHEAYARRWEKDSSGLPGERFHRDDPHWEQMPWEGELEIHDVESLPDDSGYISYSVRFWCRAGLVRDLIAKKEIRE